MIIVYTTYPNEKVAVEITKKLIEKKLVGCANIKNQKSIYIWEEKIEEDFEVGVIYKTLEEKKDEVIKFIEEHHPYSVPFIMWFKVDVNNDYLKWLSNTIL